MKPLKISALESTGGMVPETPIEKTIDWYDLNDAGELVPTQLTVHVLQLSYQKFDSIIASPPDLMKTRFIAEGILFDGGETKLTMDQAGRLSKELVNELARVFNEVNGAGPGDMGKPHSKSKTSSGAS